jgi:hypothetical protein
VAGHPPRARPLRPAPPDPDRRRDLQLTDRRRALLTAALGFLQFPPQTSALRALHAWLDGWRGVGLVIEEMQRHGFTVSLRTTGADRGWVAAFHSHAMTSADG